MKNKVLIFGKGFIGDRLANALSADVSSKKICGFADADEELLKFKPNIIINCIGHTGLKNVDGCELDKDKTLYSNTFVPIILAEAALRRGVKFVHISSGCIYNFDYKKDKPVTEDEIPDFFGLFYSRSKIYAERALDVLCKEYGALIARIRIPLDNRPHPRNILTKLLSFDKVIDVPNSVTYLPDMVDALKHLIKVDARGIYNVVNEGGLRYPDLLNTYKKYVPDYKFKVIEYKKFDYVRTNLIMSVKKLKKSGYNIRPIRKVLDECVKEYIKY